MSLKKGIKSSVINVKLSRKQQRKQKRKEKKMRRNEFYTNRKKPGQFVKNPCQEDSSREFVVPKTVKIKHSDQKSSNKVITTEEMRKKEKREQLKIQKDMKKQRTKQLLEANIEEDRNIKQLEKHLKLNKRKSKTIPKSFTEDGLGYLLEVCDSKVMQSAAASQQPLIEVEEEFEEDFALMGGKSTSLEHSDSSNDDDDSYDEEIENNILDEGSSEFEESDNNSIDDNSHENDDLALKGDEITSIEHDYSSNDDDVPDNKEIGNNTSDEEDSELFEENDNDFSDDISDKNDDTDSEEYSPETEVLSKISKEKRTEESDQKRNLNKINNIKKSVTENSKKAKRKNENDDNAQKLKKLKDSYESDGDLNEVGDFNDSEEVESDSNKSIDAKNNIEENPDGTWEDIYGRLRTKDGAVLNENKQKYIPPALRAKLEASKSEDKTRREMLSRLKKRLKGLLNRLAESNMHGIASQIEDLYMNNSRNDMNDSLTGLITESLISKVITPERLLIEHVVLIAILHANVGTEVGAHFLQTVIKEFNKYLKANHEVENKELDNTVNVIAQLYNFKLFHSKLLYEILQKLSSRFGEKDIECILHILKSVGFSLRKDDPLLLKNLIVDLQTQAANATVDVKDNPRVKFMLDILLAIKNNNVSKIPNYDTSYSDHLKKIMKGFIRKGNYVQQLNISLEDLVNADERGKWWIVGSAWTGNAPENTEKPKKLSKSSGFSEKLLELAAKQRMNTDVRRNIFCIIMSAEDYLDAFEKLLHLELKNQQEREIINVMLHCCLHEKVYNPYYAILAQKFCEYDRKYQMIIKYSMWDKLKSLSNHSGSQISNLAKMLTHLFIEKGLSISTLKIVEFSELDKVTLRFMRQILLGILLHKDSEACLSVFEKVAQSDKLKIFRESLRLFIHHFLLKNLKTDKVPDDQKALLESRAKTIEKLLISKESKLKF